MMSLLVTYCFSFGLDIFLTYRSFCLEADDTVCFLKLSTGLYLFTGFNGDLGLPFTWNSYIWVGYMSSFCKLGGLLLLLVWLLSLCRSKAMSLLLSLMIFFRCWLASFWTVLAWWTSSSMFNSTLSSFSASTSSMTCRVDLFEKSSWSSFRFGRWLWSELLPESEIRDTLEFLVLFYFLPRSYTPYCDSLMTLLILLVDFDLFDGVSYLRF